MKQMLRIKKIRCEYEKYFSYTKLKINNLFLSGKKNSVLLHSINLKK